ncbi:MAG: enoyl-CoA hydratase-related protein [Gammaproteobacteria bacterium]|nr:enoyl-CoA hydratase-related protein [Gammaproteobacteria bacterium]MCY4218188.1 enoyl-CoA hydratase-related protein [Gammaproteobacteria bacterium]MCY4273939.1 enoyl-CoA hydratase-related protein [Gammaproteobacteria bacterium]
MKYREITLEIDQRSVAWLTLNREAKHNSMNSLMMREILEACKELSALESVRAVVLTGSGEKSFSAGADLGWMRENFERNRKERRAESGILADMLEALNRLDKITIARVNGQAYAGGVGLICVCDIAICVRTARFALTETRLGLTPANISPYVMERLGMSNCRRILLNSYFFDAQEALNMGLIHKRVDPKELDEAVEAEIQICLDCAPGAIATTKQLLRKISTQSADENRSYTAELLAEVWETDEAQNGIRAFFDKKPPPWKQ